VNYEQALALEPQMVAARIGLADCCKNLGEFARAEQVLTKLIADHRDNALAHHHHGVLLEQKGDILEAADAYRRAIELAPRLGLAHYQLAQLKGHRTTDDELQSRLRVYRDPDLTAEQRSPLALAISIGYEQRKDFAEAFRYLSEGNDIKARLHPYDDAKVDRFHDSIRRAHTAMHAQELAVDSSHGPRIAFVLGMPRSGTSLTEQLLASHPEVHGAGEVACMEDTIRLLGRLTGTPFPDGARVLTTDHLREMRTFYLQALGANTPDAGWIVDKTPMNFQYIGIISRMMPDAMIIHCRRDPLDNCLSIYQRLFDATHTYSHDLEALGHYYRRYWELMQFWTAQAPDRVLDVGYEETVTDLERQAHRLCGFLGLPFDNAMLRFYQTERVVMTPSASQVRQPIYRDSVASWRKYAQYLGPLRDSLGDLCDAPALEGA
jgi:tetratricopeptide (TPR) repeat protein